MLEEIKTIYKDFMPLEPTREDLENLTVSQVREYREAIVKHRVLILTSREKVLHDKALKNTLTNRVRQLTKKLKLIDKYLKTKRNMKKR